MSKDKRKERKQLKRAGIGIKWRKGKFKTQQEWNEVKDKLLNK